MAVINQLKIQQFRNLSSVEIDPSPRFNIIFGDNASGKTSLLEAIYMLSVNRSFRTKNLHYLIAHGADQCAVFSRIHTCTLSSDSVHDAKLGVSRNRSKETQFKINETKVKKASELAQFLPTISIDPASFELIEGAPSNRRSLLDWLVFHVKPEFLALSRNYQRVLKQRNMLLRSGKLDYAAYAHWDSLLIEAALGIERLRAPILDEISTALSAMLAETGLLSGLDVEIEYRSGWGKDHLPKSSDISWYKARLAQSFDTDLQRVSTQIGSHRHDIKIKTSSGKASEFLSRGQKKSVILALYLCLAKLLRTYTGKSPIFLLDDLPSELDKRHLAWLCAKIYDLEAQVFISCVEAEPLMSLEMFAQEGVPSKKFHVKQGVVYPC